MKQERLQEIHVLLFKANAPLLWREAVRDLLDALEAAEAEAAAHGYK